jgi:NAD(P)H-dependent FMN reductase
VLGARGIEQLRLVLIELKMAPLSAALHVSSVREKLKDDLFHGDTRDESRFDAAIEDLLWWTNALREARTVQS